MSGRVWFITGTSSGLGRETVEYVLEQGERVVATLRKPDALDDLRAQYPEEQLIILKLDVTNPAHIKDTFQSAINAFGRVDVVFNNAGMNLVAEAEGTTDELARSVFETNFWGAANVSREAVRIFREVNKPVGGRILNASAFSGISGTPAVSYYSASKFALEGFASSLARELDPDWNIKITTIEFGYFGTKFFINSVVAAPHPAYIKPTLHATSSRTWIKNAGSEPPGNTKRAISKLYELSLLDDPPLHLALGKDSVTIVKKELKTSLEQLEQYESWSDSILPTPRTT